jgi:hypothetical protein
MFHWIIESRRRQVTQLADGDLSWQEYHKLLNVIDGARIHHWRNLFDATDAHLAMTSADLLNLGARIRDQVSRHTMGPLAIVTPRVETESFARFLGFLATADRPIRIFRNIERAQIWLDSA